MQRLYGAKKANKPNRAAQVQKRRSFFAPALAILSGLMYNITEFSIKLGDQLTI